MSNDDETAYRMIRWDDNESVRPLRPETAARIAAAMAADPVIWFSPECPPQWSTATPRGKTVLSKRAWRRIRRSLRKLLTVDTRKHKPSKHNRRVSRRR